MWRGPLWAFLLGSSLAGPGLAASEKALPLRGGWWTCLEIQPFPPPLAGLPSGQERKGTSAEPGDKALGAGRKETEAGYQEELPGAPKAVRLWDRVSVVGDWQASPCSQGRFPPYLSAVGCISGSSFSVSRQPPNSVPPGTQPHQVRPRPCLLDAFSPGVRHIQDQPGWRLRKGFPGQVRDTPTLVPGPGVTNTASLQTPQLSAC